MRAGLKVQWQKEKLRLRMLRYAVLTLLVVAYTPLLWVLVLLLIGVEHLNRFSEWLGQTNLPLRPFDFMDRERSAIKTAYKLEKEM